LVVTVVVLEASTLGRLLGLVLLDGGLVDI
jgi:hypothetical protein